MTTAIDTSSIVSMMPTTTDPLSQATSVANGSNARIDKASQDFEAVFLGEMMQHMFENVDFSGMGGDPQSQDVYREWLVNEYGRMLAKSGGIGIAAPVKQQLLHLQEISHAQ